MRFFACSHAKIYFIVLYLATSLSWGFGRKTACDYL